VLLATGLLLFGCGSSADAGGVISRAQDGLARIRGGVVSVHATLKTPIPIKRDLKLRADQLPLAKLELTRWTSHARRLSCGEGLECARADLDVHAALRSLGPAVPELPVDPGAIHDARLEVALGKRDRKPKFLRLSGNVDTGTLVGGVPFEVELDLPR